MKKALFAVALFLLALTFWSGICEDSIDNIITRDFGDFTMTMNKGITCIEREKDNEDGWFDLILNYKADGTIFDTGMICGWISDDTYVYNTDINAFVDEMVSLYSGLTHADNLAQSGNISIISASSAVQDGEKVYVVKLSHKFSGGTIYSTHRVVSRIGFGSYLFIDVASSTEESSIFDELFSSIKWNNNTSEDINRKSTLTAYNFDDFTMEFNPDIIGHVNEREAYKAYFKLYPDFDAEAAFHQTINCVWIPSIEDLTQIDVTEFSVLSLQSIASQFKAANMNFENASILSAEISEINGKYAFKVVSKYDIDKITLYTAQIYVSDKSFGSYIFTASSNDMTQIGSLVNIINTVKWKG